MPHSTDMIAHTTQFVTPVVVHHERSIQRLMNECSYHGATSRSLPVIDHWLEREIAQGVHNEG